MKDHQEKILGPPISYLLDPPLCVYSSGDRVRTQVNGMWTMTTRELYGMQREVLSVSVECPVVALLPSISLYIDSIV